MKLKGFLLIGAATQFALVANLAPRLAPTPPNAQTGQGFFDAVACAGCIATGIVLVSSGAAAGAAVAIAAGGVEAIGAGAAVAACVDACINALS